jgi:nitrite reductase (NADH) large subunit
VAAGLACLLVLGALSLPAIPYASSVQQAFGWDFTFRDEFGKQVSGFSLLGVSLAGLLLSVRKRLGWLASFTQARMRAFHVVAGTLAALAYVVHTGLRLGANLDRVLALFFLATVLLGGCAALLPWLARRVPRSSQLKPTLEKVHLYAVWPLPVLVAFHVIKVYFF